MALHLGGPAPWFHCAADANPRFTFSSLAGRCVVLSFLGSTALPRSQGLLQAIATDPELRGLFDDQRACFFGVSIEPADRQRGAVDSLPGVRFFRDHDRQVSRLYGAQSEAEANPVSYSCFSLILDLRLRIAAILPLDDPAVHAQQIKAGLRELIASEAAFTANLSAPVLVVPRVFEPDFCRQLIELYNTTGGSDSGFMVQRNGKTEGQLDHSFKRRKDCPIEDPSIIARYRACIRDRLAPQIAMAFQFHIAVIERYVVACYSAESGGFFRPHRDNTTSGTAHRRFACTINLNTDAYEGGDLRFPEYGMRTYRAPTGGAVVFSGSLLHEALPVTRGTRYCTLPFLHDRAAEEIRRQNLSSLSL